MLQSEICSKERLQVENKPWSDLPACELESSPKEDFCHEDTSTSLLCQEPTKENIQCEDSSEKYQEDIALSAPCESVTKEEKVPKEEAPIEESQNKEETDTQSDIVSCKAPNENTPCEDTPDENTPCEDTPDGNIIPNKNETGIEKGTEATNDGTEKKVSVVVEAADGLLNQPIHISSDFVAEMSVKAVKKRFGRTVAEALKVALKHVKKPGHWFIKLIKKKNSKSIKSN